MTTAERIAESTWCRLRDARAYSVRLGEETITDLLVLDFMRSEMQRSSRVFHITKQKEAQYGIDLLIVTRIDSNSAAVLAVQAKKLYNTERYDSLNHRVGDNRISQLDLLESFAWKRGCIPLYLLYNYTDLKTDELARYWHCSQQPCQEQLGCTLVPSWRIREALKHRGQRKFREIHRIESSSTTRKGDALPWRCVFDCNDPNRSCHLLSRLEHNKRCLENEISIGHTDRFEVDRRPALEDEDWYQFLEDKNTRIQWPSQPSDRKQLEVDWYQALETENIRIQWPSRFWDQEHRPETLSAADCSEILGQDVEESYKIEARELDERFTKHDKFLPKWVLLHDGLVRIDR